MKTLTKYQSFLIGFEGFYNSIYEYDDQNVIEYINEGRKQGIINFDNLNINYREYEKNN